MAYLGPTTVVGNLTVTGTITAGTKSFLIDDPRDPEHRVLVHGCLEGPEHAIYLRGESQLYGGFITIYLPTYFRAITHIEGRTVLVTPIFEDMHDEVSQLATSKVREDHFMVKSIDQNNPYQKFFYEVKATRKDVPALEVEQIKKASEEAL